MRCAPPSHGQSLPVSRLVFCHSQPQHRCLPPPQRAPLADSSPRRPTYRRFAQSKADWQAAYALAYVKMMSQFANWAPKAFSICGRECYKGWRSTTATMTNQACITACSNRLTPCPSTCVCSTAFYQGTARTGGLDSLLQVRNPPAILKACVCTKHTQSPEFRLVACAADAV
jgi:hypothetical protein